MGRRLALFALAAAIPASNCAFFDDFPDETLGPNNYDQSPCSTEEAVSGCEGVGNVCRTADDPSLTVCSKPCAEGDECRGSAVCREGLCEYACSDQAPCVNDGMTCLDQICWWEPGVESHATETSGY